MKKVIFLSLFLVAFVACKSEKSTKQEAVIDVSAKEFNQLVSGKDVQLIDVRTPGEFENGHLKNAQMINYMGSDFKTEAVKNLDKSKPIYVYCASGGRSSKAAKIYKDAGFTKVYNLLGGYRAWTTDNFETVK